MEGNDLFEFRLLGNVQATLDGRNVDVGSAKRRSVLAVLLLEVNQVVSTDQLVDRIWGAPQAPKSARSTLYSYLSRLRAAGIGVERLSGGYALTADPMTIDLHRFRDLVTRARRTEDDVLADAWYAQALALFRGPVLSGLDAPWLNTVRAAVEEDRRAAELDHTDLLLRRGRHGTMLADLSGRVAARPLDERLSGQLMLALYRCGRTADALGMYGRLRALLRDELGMDPGRALRDLQHAILVADPVLAARERRLG